MKGKVLFIVAMSLLVLFSSACNTNRYKGMNEAERKAARVEELKKNEDLRYHQEQMMNPDQGWAKPHAR